MEKSDVKYCMMQKSKMYYITVITLLKSRIMLRLL